MPCANRAKPQRKFLYQKINKSNLLSNLYDNNNIILVTKISIDMTQSKNNKPKNFKALILAKEYCHFTVIVNLLKKNNTILVSNHV